MSRGISRREMLGLMGAAALGYRPGPAAAALAPRMKCRPVISGVLWGLEATSLALGESGWREELDQQHRIGFDLLWLSNVPAALDAPGDPVGHLLDLCAKRKVRVMLDTGASSAWYNPFDPEAEIERCAPDIKLIGQRYAGHPAFRYWYIPHEIYMAWDDFARKVDVLYPSLAERCKKAADLPVAVSPFFILDSEKLFGGGFRYNEPEDYERYWTRLIKRSALDIVMLQDSAEHLSFCTNERRRPFFAAMSAACAASGAKFWGNVECAEVECPSPEEYLRRYGRTHISAIPSAPWRPVPIERLESKLDLAAEYAEDIVTWGYREFCRPGIGAAAKQWYDDYKAYRQGVCAVRGKTMTQGNKIWAWAHDVNAHAGGYGIPWTSTATPAEGARSYHAGSVVMCTPPSEERAATLAGFEQVIWQITSGPGFDFSQSLDAVRTLARKHANIKGVIIDDLTSVEIGRGMTPEDLAKVREKVKSGDVPLSLWGVLYTMNFGIPRISDYMSQLDVVTFWTWRASDLIDLATNFEKAEQIVKGKPMMLGIYVYDFGGARQMPMDMMRHQCDTAVELLEAGRAKGVIMLATCNSDYPIPAVDYAKEWAGKVGGVGTRRDGS